MAGKHHDRLTDSILFYGIWNYHLPPMEFDNYVNVLKDGYAKFNRTSGILKISDHLRCSGELKILPAALRAMGHRHTYSWTKETLPLYAFFVFLACIAPDTAFPSARSFIPG